MDHQEAAARLQEHRQLERTSARAASWSIAGSLAGLAVGTGIVVDADMVWLIAVFVFFWSASFGRSAVKARTSGADQRRVGLFAGSLVVALAAYVLVQFPARAAELPVPNTIGGLAAAVVLLAVARPCYSRMIARS
ncbi:hypothetical protein ACOACO_16605 [Nocardioides sp. CPCC 205120]|uniref:hypothetical protein n=1 Tax=Nocardioides sp. CPCC 205120 TaxID=3406462 RepID=UPI003B506162